MSDSDGFDGFLTTLGFGRWQIPMLLLPFFVMSLFPVHLLGASFLNAPLPFRCFTGQTPLCERATEGCWRNSSSASNLSAIADETYYNSKCLIPSANTNLDEGMDGLTLNGTKKRTSLPSCPIIEYDHSIFTSTVISEWDLVCERASLRPLFVTLNTIGNMLGSLIGGYIGDRWGRRRAVQIGSVVNILIVIAMASVPYYSLVLFTRFIAGCSLLGTLVPAWSLALESTPCRYRHLVGMLLGLPFSAFLIAFAGMAYLIRSWHYLLLAGGTPSLLLLLCSFIASESPRWSLQKGRLEEATKTIQQAVKLNKLKLSEPLTTILSKMNKEVEESTTENQSCQLSALEGIKNGLQYLRSPVMRTTIVVMAILWFVHYLLYLGVALNANNFSSGDPFLYVALTGVMDASAIILITPITAFCGRLVILFAGFMGGGILLLLDLAIPLSYYWLKWVMVMSGFFLVAGSIQLNYMYAPEVFPTAIRARGFAFVQVMGNLGASIAPFITDILAQYNWWVTGVTFGCAGILAGLLVPLLPETKNKPLPETLQDVEDRRRSRKEKRDKQGIENKTYVEDSSCHL